MNLEDLDLDKLAERLAERLAARDRLTTLALKLGSRLVRSGVIDQNFSKHLTAPGDTVRFCPQAHTTYDNLRNCGDKSNPKFECKGDEIYDCGWFTCPSPYSCTYKVYDHNCGENFFCKNFDCNGAHMFLCSNDYICQDTFTCRTCNVKQCQGKEYWMPENPGGGIDKKAGDFRCGWAPLPTTEVFTCQDKFSCDAEDEFECAHTTTFTCGDGLDVEDFTCTAGANDKGFECNEPSGFQCKQRAPYNP
jgi:hypothetical protein